MIIGNDDINDHLNRFINDKTIKIKELISNPNTNTIIDLVTFVSENKYFDYENYHITISFDDFGNSYIIDMVSLKFNILKDDLKSMILIDTLKRKVYSVTKERMIKIKKLKLI